MRASWLIPLAIMLVGKPASSQEGSEGKKATAPEVKAATAPARPASATPEELVVLDTTKGRIVIRLFDQDAPKHCQSYRSLVRKGFYDGTFFHRLVDGFVIQGGDPNTKDSDETNDGMGGPGYKLKNESNRWKHLRGRVAAARGEDLDSAGCQFYVCLRDLPQLDEMRYTVFGEVVEGMDVVDKIVKVPKKRQTPYSREVSYPVEKTYIRKAGFIAEKDLKPEGGEGR